MKCRYCASDHVGRCQAGLRWYAVIATNEFIRRIVDFTGNDDLLDTFQEPNGAGTDGTLWTDDQFREWVRAVSKRVGKIMESKR